jgi:hypothetical protein
MEEIHREIEGLPSSKTPILDNVSYELLDHELRFPYFDDSTEWVITFPLFSQTLEPYRGSGLNCSQYQKFEMWITTERHATRRPCVRMRGEPITCNDRERMTSDNDSTLSHTSRVGAQLSVHAFPQIGSLLNRQTQRFTVLSFHEQPIAFAIGKSTSKRQSRVIRLRWNIFSVVWSTYASYMQRSNHQKSVINILRCVLLPSRVLADFSRGTFVLCHGKLGRNALLFDENCELTGVIKTDWSMSEPL